jgi:hypothetical protein
MASERQILANQQNAQLSTGPRTAEGKARVAQNALKHGLTAKQVIFPHETAEEYEAFREALLISLNPEGALEEVLAEKIIADAWRMRRALALEAAVPVLARERQKVATLREEAERFKPISQRALLRTAMTGGNLKGYDNAMTKVDEAQRAIEADHLLHALLVVNQHNLEFSILDRREQALTRSFMKTLHELQRLQAKRAGEPVILPAAVDVDVSLENQNGAESE